MTPERWRHIKELMTAALTVNGEERAAFVHSESAGDADLEREALSLLESHEQAGEFLESSTAGMEILAEELQVPAADLASMRVGAYRLIREAGRGGMGAVYLAARAVSFAPPCTTLTGAGIGASIPKRPCPSRWFSSPRPSPKIRTTRAHTPESPTTTSPRLSPA